MMIVSYMILFAVCTFYITEMNIGIIYMVIKSIDAFNWIHFIKGIFHVLHITAFASGYARNLQKFDRVAASHYRASHHGSSVVEHPLRV